MALTTYSGLKTAVADYLGGRTDSTSRIVDAVSLCSQRIHYGSYSPQFGSEPLRLRAMEKRSDLRANAAQSGGTSAGSANAQTCTLATTLTAYSLGLTITFTAGYTNTATMTMNVDSVGAVTVYKEDGATALASGDVVAGDSYTIYHDGTNFRLIDPGQVPLPTSYLQMRSLYIDGTPRQSLDYVTPEQMNDLLVGSSTGKPKNFTIEGEFVRFAPVMDANYVAKMYYYKKFDAFSEDSDTNWLLTNYPAVYLYGTLLELNLLFQDTELAIAYHAEFMGAVRGLMQANERDRFSGSVLTIRSDVGNP